MKVGFLLVTTAPLGRIENKVIGSIHKILCEGKLSESSGLIEANPFYLSWSIFKAIYRSKVVVIHSPLLHALPLSVVCRLFRTELWALVWDHYPVKVAGRRFDVRISRKLADILEGLTLKLCTQIFVPTSDFLKIPAFSSASVMRMWPRFTAKTMRASHVSLKYSKELRIIFAGQVNETRGLEQAFELLQNKVTEPFTFLIASRDSPPKQIISHPNVRFLGFCTPGELNRHYRECDFGLVSLAPDFDGPAFPSKTLDYVAAGLPTLFFGPALERYLNIIENSGVGISLRTIHCLDQSVANQLKKSFRKSQNQFVGAACLNRDEVVNFFTKNKVN